MHSLKDPETSAAIADALYYMALVNASAQIGIVDQVKDALQMIAGVYMREHISNTLATQ
jgi:hypothetical protein